MLKRRCPMKLAGRSLAGLAVILSAALDVAIAQALTSPSYVLETSSAGVLGGESSSAGYSSSGIAGQATTCGSASSGSFSQNSGLLNDADLDGDGVRGSQDGC